VTFPLALRAVSSDVRQRVIFLLSEGAQDYMLQLPLLTVGTAGY
jgi:hypothetical protein